MAFIQSMSSVWSPLNKFSPVEFIKDIGHGPCSQTTYLGSEITKTQLPKMLEKNVKSKILKISKGAFHKSKLAGGRMDSF